jgi:hypothetical protein
MPRRRRGTQADHRPPHDEEAELLEQAARVDVVSQNEFVRQAVLGHIVARKADPAYQAAVRHAVKANQRVFERLVVLVWLTKNHALPDGNKRPALATTIACRDGNGFDWRPPAADDSDGGETYQLMLVIAAAPARIWSR